MMRPDVRGRFFHKEVTPINTHIASIEIAKGTEGCSTLGNHRDGGHRHRYINNGFRIEAGHCSAAHMLDVYYKVPDVLVKDTPFLLEKVMPVRMVSNNLYSISF